MKHLYRRARLLISFIKALWPHTSGLVHHLKLLASPPKQQYLLYYSSGRTKWCVTETAGSDAADPLPLCKLRDTFGGLKDYHSDSAEIKEVLDVEDRSFMEALDRASQPRCVALQAGKTTKKSRSKKAKKKPRRQASLLENLGRGK